LLFPAVIAGLTFLIAWRFGCFVAGGSDSYGYLSQARLWVADWPILEEPLIKLANWTSADWTFSPLGYRPGVTAGTIVPVYSVGYPLIMAGAIRLFGPGAEMFIVPFAAAGLVLCTAWLGRLAGGDLVGTLSACVLATSPIFVFQSLQPMSDIPVAFLWALATVLACRPSVRSSLMIAPVVATAILVRPNLAPVALPLVVLAYIAARERAGQARLAAAAVSVGAVCGGAATAYVHVTLFGDPLRSGYGSLDGLYAARYVTTNLARYGGWLWDTETIIGIVALIGIFALHRRGNGQRTWAWYSLAFVALICLAYVFYTPFEGWTYLRFLLPALPFLIIAALSAGRSAGAALTVAAVVTAGHLYFHNRWLLLDTATHEQRYVRVGNYINRFTPGNAIFISQQQSGSIRYYTGRKTLRFDWLPERALDRAIARLQELGYRPYFVLEEWEEPIFKTRFRRSSFGALDWAPTAQIPAQINTRIYDPAVKQADSVAPR
jgi:hypothetical protein